MFDKSTIFRYVSPRLRFLDLEGKKGNWRDVQEECRACHAGLCTQAFFFFWKIFQTRAIPGRGSFVSRMKRRKPGVHPGSDHTISGNIYFDITNKPDRRVWLVCCSTEWGREGKALLRFQQLADGIARRRWHGWGPAGGRSCWCGYRKHRHPCSR